MMAVNFSRSWSCHHAVILAAYWLSCSVSLADDWPHWRGPTWDDRSAETGLLQEWPPGGPQRLWINQQAGAGYAGFSIVDSRLFTMGMQDNEEFALCLDAETGQELWRQPFAGRFENRWGDGPRSTPTIDHGRVYVLAADGTLACLDAADGQIQWKINLTEFGGSVPFWGYSESPLVDGEKVVCTPGGSLGTLLAVDKNTGKMVWQSEVVRKAADGDDGEPAAAHYASMIPIEWGGKRQYVQLTVLAVVGIDAETGKILWQSDWPGRVAVIPSPLFDQGKVYVTSGYSIGSKLIELDQDNQSTELWFNKVMQNHHGGVIPIGACFYGSSDKAFMCQDQTTGERKWAERRITKGAVGYADGRLYHVQEADGKVLLLEVNEDKPAIKGMFKLDPQTQNRKPDGRIWVHPVIANGRLYLRDQEIIYCYDIKAAD